MSLVLCGPTPITINILLTILPESCKTLGTDSEPCVFPFIYEGVRYNQCTSQDAAEGAVWCATQVSTNGTVIEGRWGDCTDGCPGARKNTSSTIHSSMGRSHLISDNKYIRGISDFNRLIRLF